jgi:hypothetical protein
LNHISTNPFVEALSWLTVTKKEIMVNASQKGRG